MFGFSLVTVIFEDRTDSTFARQRVLERLNYLGGTLPEGVEAKLGPDATGLGWVYQYYLMWTRPLIPMAATIWESCAQLQGLVHRYQLNAVQASRKWRALEASSGNIRLKLIPRRCARLASP